MGKTYRLATKLGAGLVDIYELILPVRFMVGCDGLFASTALSRRAADIIDGCSRHLWLSYSCQCRYQHGMSEDGGGA
jgi:hypothetical protein